MEAVANQSMDLLLADTVRGPELTEEEKQIVATLFTRTSEEVEVFIPDDISQDTLHSWLRSSANVRAKLEHAQRKIKPIMGRMFVIVSKRQDLLDSFESASFSQFMNIYVPKHFAISPQEAWSAYWTVREFPDISCDDYEAVGISKLKMIARAVPRHRDEAVIDPSVVNQRRMLIEVAKDNRRSVQFASKIEELGVAKRNQVIQDKIIIFCDLQMREAFDAMCSDPRVIEYVGSDHPTAVMGAMMKEFYASAMSASIVE